MFIKSLLNKENYHSPQWSNSFPGKKKKNTTFIFSKPYKETTSNNFKNTYFVCQHDGKDGAH